MSWLTRIAERLIESARDAGDLSNLKGEGAPLSIDRTGIDPLDEAGMKVMKSEGVVPPEVALYKRAAEQRAALAEAETEETRRIAMAALSDTQMRLAMMSERRRGLRY